MMVENFGSYLKHERELRGVPLEEISGATKIHIRYLKALEENSFDQLPGEVFVKGYIRSYASIIGSDVEEVLNIYRESVEFNNQESIPQKTTIFRMPTKTFLVYGLSILAIAGIMFGVGILIKNGIGGSSGKVDLPRPALLQMPVAKQEPAIISTPDLPDKPLVEEIVQDQEIDSAGSVILEQENPVLSDSSDILIKKEDEKDIPVQKPDEQIMQTPSDSSPYSDSQDLWDAEKSLKLTIRAKETSWFNMIIDDLGEEDFILPAGTAKTFLGNETFRLTIGNKTGVELSLNGETLTLPESKDKVVKDFIINSKLIE